MKSLKAENKKLKLRITNLEEDNRVLGKIMEKFMHVDGTVARGMSLGDLYKMAGLYSKLKKKSANMAIELAELKTIPSWYDLRSEIKLFQFRTKDAPIKPSQLMLQIALATTRK